MCALPVVNAPTTQQIGHVQHNTLSVVLKPKMGGTDFKTQDFRRIPSPWEAIDAFFESHSMVKHQIDSFNDFVIRKMEHIIEGFNTIEICHQYMPELKRFKYKLLIDIINPTLSKPTIHEKDGSTKIMTPNDARLRNFTYAVPLNVDVKVATESWDSESNRTMTDTKRINGINIGKIPLMVRSKYCILHTSSSIDGGFDGVDECAYDVGGYFVINGNEKVVISQDRISENKTFVFSNSRGTSGYSYMAEIRSVSEKRFGVPKTTCLKMAARENQYGRHVRVNLHHIKHDVPLFILFKALGMSSDKAIVELIVGSLDEDEAISTSIGGQDAKDAIVKHLVASVHEATDIKCQAEAIEYMSRYLQINGYPKEVLADKAERFAITQRVLAEEFLPHVGNDAMKKALYLAFMARKLMCCFLGIWPMDDRDSYINKRVDTPGVLMANLFRQYYGKMIKDMKAMIQKDINNGPWKATGQFTNIITKINIYKIIKSSIIESGMKYALSTGNWGIKSNNSKQGVAQVLNRMTYNASVSHLRRVNTPLEKSGKLIQPRKLHSTQFGYICPSETPEGASVGLVKNLAMMAFISIASTSQQVRDMLSQDKDMYLYGTGCAPPPSSATTMIIINGDIVGIHNDPAALYASMKQAKRTGIISIFSSVVWDVLAHEIRFNTEGGRLLRPLFVVHRGPTNDAANSEEREMLSKWDHFIMNGVVEYLDVDECNSSMIAMKAEDLVTDRIGASQRPRYTHLEIHPSMMLGALAGSIPFSDHNQAPRNTYQSCMGKQAIGVYSTNFRHRMDTMAHVLNYPQKPIVQTRTSKLVNADTMPSGVNAIVAIMCMTGFNQEDSIIMNKSAIDRGLFASTYYRTYKDQNNRNHSNGEEEFFIKPEPEKTVGMKPYNYEKLSQDGFVPENTAVDAGDVIIGKCMPQKRDATIVYKDTSVSLKNNESGFIDRNCYGDKLFTNVNGDGYTFSKVRIRNMRMPTIGDKFSCYSPDHEILTRDQGWIRFDALTPNDCVATLVDNELVYQYPTEVQVYDGCRGKTMYVVKTQHVDLCVTPNHRMYVKEMAMPRRGNDDTQHDDPCYETPLAQDIYGLARHYKRNADHWTPHAFRYGEDNHFVLDEEGTITHFLVGNYRFRMRPWVNMIGAWYANSSADITSLLHDLVEDDADNARLMTLAEYFAAHEQECGNMVLPQWVMTLDREMCTLLLERLVNGGIYPGATIFDTKSERLRDQFQQLCLHAGHAATWHLYAPDVWRCVIVDENEPLVNKYPKECREAWVPYTEDKVYCCTVPKGEGVVYVRRGGLPVWCGQSKHGQKGTVGMVYRQEDMPFTKDGLVPDLIINPHAIPSRMTIAQLMECILSKTCTISGTYGDATPFTDITVEAIATEMEHHGYDRYGNEVMYNPRTGEQIQTEIFVGPTLYQRLKHMTCDKVHSRSNAGPIVLLTRQPAEGRAREGGLRIGEMEQETNIGHGIMGFLKERFMESSDNYRVYVCKKCGTMANVNPDKNIFDCKPCKNSTHFAEIRIPYAAKLLFQELNCMAISTRFATG